MPDPRAFVSFDYDNNFDDRVLFCGQIKNSRTPFNVQDWSSKKVLPERQWEELIESKIKSCHMLIVLIGEKSYAATGVLKEITFARNNDVPIFGVYVGDAGIFTPLPPGLTRNRAIKWDWKEIASQVDLCMLQGKNLKKI